MLNRPKTKIYEISDYMIDSPDFYDDFNDDEESEKIVKDNNKSFISILNEIAAINVEEDLIYETY